MLHLSEVRLFRRAVLFSDFNSILQVCQLLPLAIWDGHYGVIKILPSNFKREVLCKIYTVAALGVFQPFLLLLGCFLCSHALRCATWGIDTAVSQH